MLLQFDFLLLRAALLVVIGQGRGGEGRGREGRERGRRVAKGARRSELGKIHERGVVCGVGRQEVVLGGGPCGDERNGRGGCVAAPERALPPKVGTQGRNSYLDPAVVLELSRSEPGGA